MSPRKLAKDVLTAAVEQALEEQCSAAHQLHALLQGVGTAMDGTGQLTIDDPQAALDGLASFASRLSTALDADTFAQRVAEIEAEAKREEAEEAAEKAHPGRTRRMLLGEPEPPTDPRKGLRVVTSPESGEQPA